MTCWEVEPTVENVRYVVENMRECDRKEIMALRWNDDLGGFLQDCISAAGHMWRVWEKDGVPVALVGITPMRPGVVRVGAFGTKDWQHAVRPIIKWAHEWAVPQLVQAGFHRGEAYALASNTSSRKFIEALGGEIESPLYHYGREREDFLLYVWRLDDGRGTILHATGGGAEPIQRSGGSERGGTSAADGRTDGGPEIPDLRPESEPRQHFANGEGEQQDRLSA